MCAATPRPVLLYSPLAAGAALHWDIIYTPLCFAYKELQKQRNRYNKNEDRNNQEKVSSDAIEFYPFIKQRIKWNSCDFNKLEACKCDLLNPSFDFLLNAGIFCWLNSSFFFFFFSPPGQLLACLGTAASNSLCCPSVKKCAHVGGLAPSHPGCWMH